MHNSQNLTMLGGYVERVLGSFSCARATACLTITTCSQSVNREDKRLASTNVERRIYDVHLPMIGRIDSNLVVTDTDILLWSF